MIDPTQVLSTSSHEALVSVLSYERRILEQLLFRHIELSMLINAGEHRFVARALDEVNTVEGELGAAEILRAAVVEALVPDVRDPGIDTVIDRSPAALTAALESLALDLRRLHEGIEAQRTAAYDEAGRRAEMLASAQARLNAGGYRSDGSAVSGA